MILKDDTVTAVDLSDVMLIKSEDSIKDHGFLTSDDLKYQEERRKRKIRKLTYEERWSTSMRSTTIIWQAQRL